MASHEKSDEPFVSWLSTVPSVLEAPVENEVRVKGGRFFHELWVSLGQRYCPGNLPLEFVIPWEALEPWEQQSAVAIYELVQHFVWTVGWPIEGLQRDQKGSFVYTCWLAQVFKHTPETEQTHWVDWEHLPAWKREMYIRIFEQIEEFQEVGDIPNYLRTELRYEWS